MSSPNGSRTPTRTAATTSLLAAFQLPHLSLTHSRLLPVRNIVHSDQRTATSQARAAIEAYSAVHSPPVSRQVNPSIHPQFRSKSVCSLFCHHCSSELCERGMRAILLGNINVELFSTDIPPSGVALVYNDYLTKNCAYEFISCSCRIRDAACLGCGNVVGYHVTAPCNKCLESCNNGHYWMFLQGSVTAAERLDKTGDKVMRWASLTCGEERSEVISELTLCR